MYLHEIFLQNTGPISECHVELPFDDAGDPLPVVVVGPNGSGKSIFLSYIVDALTEFAKKTFTDIVPENGLISPYFRIIGSTTVRSGQSFNLSLLHFKATSNDLYYCEKAGRLDPSTYSNDLKSVFDPVWNWPTEKNHKDVLVNEKTVETEMTNGAYAFFPASRREDPDWLNPESLKAQPTPFSPHVNEKLDKPLWIGTCAEENISWVLDVFLDSLSDLLPGLQLTQEQNLIFRNVDSLELIDLQNRRLLWQARQNVERILQAILQDETAKLSLNYRGVGSSRVSIRMGDGRIIPTLQSLSEGQSQLFNLFATIIRYGERTDLNRSIDLSQITGLVVIDEIDTHLHPTLQHNVLCELISLFPKVQFIVSSHSPLFLLGMEKRFGVDGVTILEMPDGNRINSERYSEFGKAFEYIQSTERYEEEIRQRFAAGTKPLILTEGPLDVRYIRRALDILGKDDLLNSLDIEFVGIVDENGKTRFGGDTGLNHFRNIYEANTSLYHRPILLLYDCDTQKQDEQVGDDEQLWIRSIKQNGENTKVKKGIENLFPEDLFTIEFYTSKVETGDYGESKSIQEFNKSKFCDWICENGSDVDFAKFDSVVNTLKEFVETYQPKEVQQPPPE